MVNSRYLAALFVAFAAGGCSLLYTVDGYDTTPLIDGATGDAAADDAGGDAIVPSLDGGDSGVIVQRDGSACPSDMANVSTFCVDRTEVTEVKYDEFLKTVNTSASIAALPTRCAWNTTFRPAGSLDGGAENSLATNCTGSDAFTPTTTPNAPVACVDWCDAYAYCAFRGKRLCGAVGGGSMTLTASSHVDASKSQWFQACAGAAGTNVFPYGATYSASACDVGGSSATDVGTHPGCEGSFPGVLDLSGSVSEWTDECAGSSVTSACGRRGGAYGDVEADLKCASNAGGDSDIKHMSQRLGFRCCLD